MLTQFRARQGIIDLGWGHPHPALLPVAAWSDAYAAALRRYGPAALTYGHGPGPGPLIEWLCDRLARTDARRPRPAEVFVTAGASQALDLICGVLLRPGDAVLVDAPTYHLALRILADHRVTLVPVPAADPEAVEHRLRTLDRRVPLLYLVPTFNNPTGGSVPDDRRAALVELARRHGFAIVEDDTYRELAYDGPAPASLYSLAVNEEVVRVGSFSKSVAPGVRLGFLTATPSLVESLADRGYVDSGGGVNHATALAMAEFGDSGAYERHLSEIRSAYRERRDRLAAAVGEQVRGARFAVPNGGWFLWVRLPPGLDAAALLPAAEAAGVSYVEGFRFFAGGGGGGYARLSYSMLAPDELAEGARRLGSAVDDLNI